MFLKIFLMVMSIVSGVVFLRATTLGYKEGNSGEALFNFWLFIMAGVMWVRLKNIKI